MKNLFKRLGNHVFRNTNMRNPDATFLFPVAFNLHWGITVSGRDCTITWGASFHQDVSSSKIQSILAVVKIISAWILGQRNLMNEMNYSVL